MSESLPGQSAFCMFDIGMNSRSHSEHDGKLKKERNPHFRIEEP